MGTSSFSKTGFISILTLTVFASGCGVSTVARDKIKTSPSTVITTENSDDETTTTTTTTETSEASAAYPVYDFTIRGVGYSSTTITVDVKDVLKIQFTPGVQDKTVQNTGFSPQYSKLGVYIKVGNTEKSTALLSNGFASEAQTSSTLDFSKAFTKTCATNDTACRQTVEITIYKPNYDYWCLNYNLYCSHTKVWDAHPWTGTLNVQTDDTEAL